jgi:acyl-CoA thioesterase
VPEPSTFARDTAIRAVGDGAFDAEIADTWAVLRGPHGGYVAAIVTRALEAAVADPERQPRSLTIHFLAPPEPGPVRIEVRVERSGRTLSTLSARMEQDGRPVALALAAFSRAWENPAVEYAEPPPDAPRPEDVPVVPWQEQMPQFRKHLEFRHVFGGELMSGADRALVGGWLRLNEPPAAFDAAYVAMLADAWAPAPFPLVTTPFVAPTIDLTVHFRSPLPPAGTGPETPILGRFESRAARDGFFEEDGALWTPGGELVAHVRQLALAIGFGGPG